jgi:hypothetical protein
MHGFGAALPVPPAGDSLRRMMAPGTAPNPIVEELP